MHGNNRLLIRRFERRIKGFNKRSLTVKELLDECHRRRIRVLWGSLRKAHGAATWADDQPYIYLNSGITESELIVTIAHELTHIIDQCKDVSLFLSTGRVQQKAKNEHQAVIIGLIALMPDIEIINMIAHGADARLIADWYDVSLELAQFRFDLMMG